MKQLKKNVRCVVIKTEKMVKLGNVVKKKEITEHEPLRAGFDKFVKVEHMDADNLRIHRWGSIKDDLFPPTFYKVFRKGQILFPTRNPHLRRVAVASFDGICGEKTLTLSPLNEKIEPNLLCYIFQSDNFIQHCINSIIGSTNPHVRWRDVAKFEFNLPERSIQRKIVKILESIESTIVSIEHLQGIAENYQKGLLEQLMKTGISKKPSKETKFGKIPIDWEIILGSKAIILESGSRPKGGVSDEGDIPSLGGEHIDKRRGVIDFYGKPKYISQSFFNNMKQGKLAPNDILINKDGALTGKMAFVSKLFESDIAINEHVFIIRNKGMFYQKFLYYFLRSMNGKWQIMNSVTGSAQPGLNRKFIKRLILPLPSIEEQKEISSLLELFDDLLSLLDSQLANVKKIKKKIINSFLSGNLNLKDVEQ